MEDGVGPARPSKGDGTVEYRRLGNTGLRVSAIGLGTNMFGGKSDAQRSIRTLAAAVESGVTLIDTANIYTGGASEKIIGEALAGPLRSERDRLVIATKVGLRAAEGPNGSGSSRMHIQGEVEKSLRSLKTDRIDLLWIHTFDAETALDETLSTLDALVRSGKVRYVGCSNHRGWEMMKALWTSDRHHLVRYQAIQVSYSLADRVVEREVLPAARDQGLGVVTYFPLAGGVLTGKYLGGQIPEDSRAAFSAGLREKASAEPFVGVAEMALEVAKEIGATPAQVALAWLLGRRGVSSAIAGASGPEQAAENTKASDITLTDEAGDRLDRASDVFRWLPPFGDFRL